MERKREKGNCYNFVFLLLKYTTNVLLIKLLGASYLELEKMKYQNNIIDISNILLFPLSI